MTKVTLDNLNSLQNENTALTTINNNSAVIEAAFDNTLSRDGTAPNQMESHLDMNNFHILNLPEPSSDTDPVRLIDMNVTNANLIHTASSTSNTIGTGTKTFTVPSNLGFQPGQYVIIQQSGNTANFMTGRVTSYGGTSLVVSVTATGGSGTINNWTIDISGAPGATGPVTTVYDTRANAVSATIPAQQTFLNLAGYTAVGDVTYPFRFNRQASVTTEQGFFQSADGAYWRIAQTDVTPEMFGCRGDGTTDDRANFQNAIDFVNSKGGGTVYLTPGKTYRIVLNNVSLNMKPYVNIRFNGAAVNMECSNNSFGLRMNNFVGLYGPGTLAVTSSVTPFGSSAMYHATISFGETYGAQGTVASPSALEGIHDMVVKGLTITNARTNYGSIIQGIGGCYNIVIEDNTFPSNSGAGVAVSFDWGFLGTLDSTNLALSKTNYLAGLAYSTHPHDIVMQRNTIGDFSATYPEGSQGLRLSGVYNVIIRDNDISSVNYAGIFVTGGDLSFEYAQSNIRLLACTNIVVEKNVIRNYRGGLGIYWDANPDNVYRAATDSGDPNYPYVALFYYDGYFCNGKISGNRVGTSSVLNTNSSIIAGYTRNLTIENNVCYGGSQGKYGIRFDKLCRNVKVLDNEISLFTDAGIFMNDAGSENCVIKGNWVHRNGASQVTMGNIYINAGTTIMVDGNYIGSNDEGEATNGIKIDLGTTYASVINNFIYEVKSGGFALNIVNGSNITTVWEVKDNRYVGSAGTASTGLTIVPFRRDYSVANPGKILTHAAAQRAAMAGDTTPLYGFWEAGSTVTNLDSVSGQVHLTKCTVAGSPGTWKAVSTVS